MSGERSLPAKSVDTSVDAAETSLCATSFATWQDRQLAVLLARSNQLLTEIRTAGREMDRRCETLAMENGRATALLEVREGEIRRLEEQRLRLQAELAELRARSGALEQQVKELTAARTELQGTVEWFRQEAARLYRQESQFAQENQALGSKLSAAGVEAANLRRLADDLQNSLSWKITAPVRALTRPLFRLLGKPAVPPAPTVGPPPAVAVSPVPTVGPVAADPLQAILPRLRQAQSVAIIPCAIPFGATLNQRPISCARYLSDHGTTVLYVAWQWQPEEAIPQAWEEVYPDIFHIPLYGFLNQVEAIAAASRGKGAYLCTLPSPSLVEMVRPLRAAGYHIHFDLMDDWEGFHAGGEAPWFVAEVEHEMVIAADTVSAVSDRLAKKFADLRGDIAVVHNGYQPAALQCEQFVAARTPLGSRKVVGYFGHFSDAWFDWDTVIQAARERPDVEFELIGWGISEQTQKRLDAVPNIRPLGIVPQGELHGYARHWWMGMIPFQPTAVSAAVDPLKVYEYLHLGLPVIVTGISGIARYPLVEFAGDSDSFVAAIDGVGARPGEPTLAEVADFLKDCVWDERFRTLSDLLAEPAGLTSLYAL